MNREIQEHAGEVVAALNEIFERKYSASLNPKELQEKTGLSEQQLQRVIDTLFASGWIEKDREFIGGYTIRLTLFGKMEFDRQTRNHKNINMREKLASALAEIYEKDPNQLSDSDFLTQKLGLERNAVCFNLRMMQREGQVEAHPYSGAGHGGYTVRLTSRGKAIVDNPHTQVLFISHAAVDKPIAIRLREALEYSFPNIRVFVSSAPDVLKPGDPWVQKILDALQFAKAALVLATDRGLSRYWVWYEAGAAWAKQIDTIFCCIGKQQKGNLPAPFSLSQAVGLNDPADLQALFQRLSELFDCSEMPNFGELAKNLADLNRLSEAQFEKQHTPESAERKQFVEETVKKLSDAQKEALRLALIHGEITDFHALSLLRQKGLNCNAANVYPALALNTGLIQQVATAEGARYSDLPRFRITSELKSILGELLFAQNEPP